MLLFSVFLVILILSIELHRRPAIVGIEIIITSEVV